MNHWEGGVFFQYRTVMKNENNNSIAQVNRAKSYKHTQSPINHAKHTSTMQCYHTCSGALTYGTEFENMGCFLFSGAIILEQMDREQSTMVKSLLSCWPLALLVSSTAGIAAVIIWIIVSAKGCGVG
jgi:hypothetical protein